MTAYKGNSLSRKLAEVLIEMETATTPGTKEDFKNQKVNTKRGSTSAQMWKVDIGREWISIRQQGIGKEVAGDPLERGLTRNTVRPWWIAVETTKELGSCLKKLDRGVSGRHQNCIRTAGQLMFMWSLAGVALEALTSYNKLNLGDKACTCIEC